MRRKSDRWGVNPNLDVTHHLQGRGERGTEGRVKGSVRKRGLFEERTHWSKPVDGEPSGFNCVYDLSVDRLAIESSFQNPKRFIQEWGIE